ncbi:PAS domain-containing protein [Methanoplanus sp. FWC-SCC4]|uniref:histidine kinase n=1 Tax=Methanochimaera problematica TaxID=2609417 RepID=A0AA97I377_9EURY|nr:PAS domain-containing protein [Methanoplanus sp. FWC-SCC4]WOF15359.1 PAS domain-containing protein [Methanoplanus sp. FWC-SCC4]
MSGENYSILIVEDEAILAMAIKKTILSYGYSVSGTAFDSEGAIKLAIEKRPDLILMDINLRGDPDGIITAKKINEIADIPVIFLTAYSDDATVKLALETNPYGYITKPFREGDLKAAIEVALQKHRLCKLEKNLFISEKKLKEAAEILELGYWEYNHKTGMEEWSDEVYKLFGIIKDSQFIDSEKFVSVIHPDDRQRVVEAFGLSVELNRPGSVEYRIIRSDGSIRYVNSKWTHHTDKGGNIYTSFGVCIDITEKVMVNRSIKENEKRLRLALKSSKQWPWDWDIKKDLVIHDPSFYNNYAYRIKSPISFKEIIEIMIHPDDAERFRTKLSRCAKGKAKSIIETFRIRDFESKGWIWVTCRGEVVEWDDSGSPLRMVGINHDVTELQNAQIAISEANKKLNLLSSVTRHDIINQMMAIIGYEELIEELDEIPKDSMTYGYLQKVFTACMEILEKIEFTKDYQDLGIEKPSWFNVDRVCRSVLKNRLFSELDVSVDTGTMELYVDPMFEKVLYNLFENAIRHGGAEKIRVTSYIADDGKGVLVVEDNGNGVPDFKKDKIFDQGYGSNTGYGLFLVKEILAITGIEIKERGTEGKGARFEITAPVEMYRSGQDS